MKARFVTKQKEVTLKRLKDGIVDVTICINEKTGTEEYESWIEKKEPITYYEYDFAQYFVEDGEIDEDDLIANPFKYLHYVKRKESDVGVLRADVDFLLMITEEV